MKTVAGHALVHTMHVTANCSLKREKKQGCTSPTPSHMPIHNLDPGTLLAIVWIVINLVEQFLLSF